MSLFSRGTGPRYLAFSFILSLGFITSSGMGFPVYADLGIVLSDTCLSLLKINASTNCPTYEEILILYPDTSNHKWSGGFDYIDGILQREITTFNNHFEFYRYDSVSITWIDPPSDILEKIPLITISASTFEYKIPFQNITNSSVSIGHDRYVSSKCDEALISAENWLFLLGDTIQLMAHDCDEEFTNFNEVKLRTWERTQHDIKTSMKWQLDKWIQETKINCKLLCFTYAKT